MEIWGIRLKKLGGGGLQHVVEASPQPEGNGGAGRQGGDIAVHRVGGEGVQRVGLRLRRDARARDQEHRETGDGCYDGLGGAVTLCWRTVLADGDGQT